MQHFRRPADPTPARDKCPAKLIAIACNTATAYARADLEALVLRAKVPVAVLGVIDAGAEAATESIEGPASVGVLATQGTVSSGAYPKAIRECAARRGREAAIQVFQQGSLGLAGAIDSACEFVAPEARKPRADYRGPSLENPLARIDLQLLGRYDFDFTTGRMLFHGDPGNPQQLQLNAVENYVAYDVTSLLETIRRSPGTPPLAAVVLGCTHFPYVADLIAAKLRRLRDYQEQGRYPYRPWLAERIALVDPGRGMARKLYRLLAEEGGLAPAPAFAPGQARAEFYITAAWPRPFTYQYKYGRGEGYTGADVRTVPLVTGDLDAPTADRLRRRVPSAWSLLDEFSRQSALGGSTPPRRESRRP